MIRCAAVYLSQYIQWLKFLSLSSYLKKEQEEEETVLCADLKMPLLEGEKYVSIWKILWKIFFSKL